MRIIEIPKYSIVMTIGPSNSGKSYLVKQLLEPSLRDAGARVEYLSSDDMRRTMLGEHAHKHDSKMMPVSKPAFELLYTKLDLFTQYPVNVDVVVVDATNLSKISRAKVYEIAERNAYNVVNLVFDYKETSDYVKYLDETTDRHVIYRMIKQLRGETRRDLDLEKKNVRHIYTIDTNDFSQLEFSYSTQSAGVEVKHENVCFVGDLHGCLAELKELLLDKKGITISEDGVMEIVPGAIDNGSYVHHVLVGDIVDKAPLENVRQLVDFLHRNRKFFVIVEGNHDRWVYNYLKNNIKQSEDNDKLIESFFDSVNLFKGDAHLRQKFFELYESMATFAYSDRFIVTHAPCQNRYLGKTDRVSLKKQNTIMYPKKKDYVDDDAYLDAREKFFDFLLKDADSSFPMHIFGHVMLPSVFNHRNKWGIDTGCVAGGKLSSLVLMKENVKPFIRKYSSTLPITAELYPLFRVKTSEVNLAAMERDLYNRIKWCAKNQLNFVSGTMSPCDKSDTELESLYKGIEYYKTKGINKIVLQPKFMGSRCNVFLHISDVSKCKAFSRNGYEIKDERLHGDKKMTDVFKELQEQYEELFATLGAEYILFDGELLPWNAMGKELIERDFMLAYKAATTENAILKETGFHELYNEFAAKFDRESTEGFSEHELRLHKVYNSFKGELLPLGKSNIALEKYKHQLDLFGGDGELKFKPFSILKSIKEDGTERNFIHGAVDNAVIFRLINFEDPMLILQKDEDTGEWSAVLSQAHVKDMPFESERSALDGFWHYITRNEEMEGVVIKPGPAYISGVAPYMKCRNTEYLRMTYGFDYDMLPVKTEKLKATKSIRRKLETSIKEWELGRKLLDVPHNQINLENQQWLSILVQLLNEQEHEKELDPRL